MTDVYGADKRSEVMRRVKGRDTTPERILRRLLTELGIVRKEDFGEGYSRY